MKHLYSMRLLVLLAFTIALSATAIYGQGFKYAEKSDYHNGSDKGEITIKIADSVLERGKSYSVEYDFHVTDGSYAVYNWQFVRLIPLKQELQKLLCEKSCGMYAPVLVTVKKISGCSDCDVPDEFPEWKGEPSLRNFTVRKASLYFLRAARALRCYRPRPFPPDYHRCV